MIRIFALIALSVVAVPVMAQDESPVTNCCRKLPPQLIGLSAPCLHVNNVSDVKKDAAHDYINSDAFKNEMADIDKRKLSRKNMAKLKSALATAHIARLAASE